MFCTQRGNETVSVKALILQEGYDECCALLLEFRADVHAVVRRERERDFICVCKTENELPAIPRITQEQIQIPIFRGPPYSSYRAPFARHILQWLPSCSGTR
eukprot:4701668-Amphidinium_carterae.1